MPIYKGNTLIMRGGGTTVIETGRSTDGTQWYRLWSDGWLEQGGNEFDGVTKYPLYHTITFVKPFTKLMSISIAMQNASNASAYNAGIKDGTVPTTTGFVVTGCFNGQSMDNAVSWYACGQS